MCNCILCLTSGGALCCAIWSASKFHLNPFRFCSLIPLVSVLFLVFLGVLMGSHPVYAKDISEEKAQNASSNAYIVAGLYFVTFIVATFMYFRNLSKEGKQLGKATKGSGNEESSSYNVPLVSDTQPITGATSASAEDKTARKKTKKSNVVRDDSGVTSI